MELQFCVIRFKRNVEGGKGPEKNWEIRNLEPDTNLLWNENFILTKRVYQDGMKVIWQLEQIWDNATQSENILKRKTLLDRPKWYCLCSALRNVRFLTKWQNVSFNCENWLFLRQRDIWKWTFLWKIGWMDVIGRVGSREPF